jgi:ABC-type glycerol-3-phosphate transport system substrate-binding protein
MMSSKLSEQSITRREALRLGVALVGVSLLAGCAPAKPPAEPAEVPVVAEPPTVPTPIVAEAGKGATELIYWNGLTGSDGVTMVEMVERFAEENQDVSARVEMMAWDVYYDKLLTSLVSGYPPDLFLLHVSSIPQFADKGVLKPSDPLFDVNGGPLPLKDFADPVFSETLYEGTRYGVVIDNHGWGFWINTDLVSAGGFDPAKRPESAAEFIQMAQVLTIDKNGKNATESGFDPGNVEQWGTCISWMRVTFLTTLFQFGGNTVDLARNRALFDQEPARQAMQFWHDMVYKHQGAPTPSGFDSWQTMAAGKLAMIPEGSWMRNFLLEHPQINWKVWKMPPFGPQPATWMSAHVLYMPSTIDGARLDAATKLSVYLSDHGLDWAESGQVPARYSQQEQLDPEKYPSTVVFAEAFREMGKFEPPHVALIELQSAYEPELDAMWNDVKPIPDGLRDANARVQAILDRAAT